MPSFDKPGNGNSRMQVGYFCHLKMGEKHVGAILVTNPIGVPVEFKYTEPVATTKLHRVLYGSVLDRYLHETVIRDRLSLEVKSHPEFFITQYEEREYLGLLAGKEMMAIQKAVLNPAERPGPFTRLKEREALVEMEEGTVLRLAFSTSDESSQQSMVAWLQEIGRTMDVLEPMDRIQTAIKVLCGEEKKA